MGTLVGVISATCRAALKGSALTIAAGGLEPHPMLAEFVQWQVLLVPGFVKCFSLIRPVFQMT